MSLVKYRTIASILFAFIILPVNGQNKHEMLRKEIPLSFDMPMRK